VLVRHLFLPSATTVLGFTGGLHSFSGPRSRSLRLAQRSTGSSTLRIGEVECTGPALQGPIPSNTLTIGLT
jgi:hypothetical protein